MFQKFHQGYVHARRVRVLSQLFAQLLSLQSSVLDVGCGDGLLAGLIVKSRPDIQMNGIDVLVRQDTMIPVTWFDGVSIPLLDQSVDVVMFIDVLHHTTDPMILLKEAKRVAKQYILIKDHTCDGPFAYPTLRFMDWVGDAAYGLALPYNYWGTLKWRQAFNTLGLKLAYWEQSLGLYPFPASLIFGRKLHMIANLQVA